MFESRYSLKPCISASTLGWGPRGSSLDQDQYLYFLFQFGAIEYLVNLLMKFLPSLRCGGEEIDLNIAFLSRIPTARWGFFWSFNEFCGFSPISFQFALVRDVKPHCQAQGELFPNLHFPACVCRDR